MATVILPSPWAALVTTTVLTSRSRMRKRRLVRSPRAAFAMGERGANTVGRSACGSEAPSKQGMTPRIGVSSSDSRSWMAPMEVSSVSAMKATASPSTVSKMSPSRARRPASGSFTGMFAATAGRTMDLGHLLLFLEAAQGSLTGCGGVGTVLA